MRVRFTRHVIDQAGRRGATLAEITEVVLTGNEDTARPGYRARALVYPFAREWKGKNSSEKRVRVIYVIEQDEIVVITVYVYYGSWAT